MTESAACLMRDGVVVAAAEEERFTRVKHAGGFPYHSIQSVLTCAGIALNDVDHIAVYWDPYRLGFRLRYMIETFFRTPELFFEKLLRALSVWKGAAGEDSGWFSLFKTKRLLGERFGKFRGKVHFLDHHLVHMASCHYGSGFNESAILIMDGAGESACTSWGVGQGINLRIDSQHLLPHSLGHFYSSVTRYLGFKMLDGEYKVTGMSPYGDPSGSKWINENFLIPTTGGRYRLNSAALDYHRALRGILKGSFVDHFGAARVPSEDDEVPQRYKDIAASAQRAFENVVLKMAKELRHQTGLSRLTIAGGCGLNCVANGKILEAGIFDQVYVPPVPHDAGGALGAAMLAYKNITGKRPEPIYHAQLGPEINDGEIAQALSARPDVNAEKMVEDEILARAAQALANGQILAWAQGPMEYGPRALGNRSFLADPRSDAIRDIMNVKIKKREPFRPFAPSVKAEKAAEYFQLQQPSSFMTIIVPVQPNKRDKIPAVTHVDGSARPQTVDREVNRRYWKLLDQFEKISGIPVLLNTSFNIQEPIVCTPNEALTTFGHSGVDVLVLGDYWVTRRP